MPYSDESEKDKDRIAFSLVKSFPKDDPRSKKIPNWEAKEAFHRLGKVYDKLSNQ
jgi:hypothetical protein